MKQILAIWMQPVYARKNLGDQKMLWSLLILPLFSMLLVIWADKALVWPSLLLAGLAGVAIDVLLLLVIWFIVLVPSIAQQFSPANACLVPEFKRPLQWALAIPIACLPLLVIALDKMLHLDKVASGFWVISVFLMLIFSALIRTSKLIWALVLATQLPLLLDGRGGLIGRLRMFDYAAWLVPLGLFMIALGLQWIFAIRGDQHIHRTKQLNTWRLAMLGQPPNRVEGRTQAIRQLLLWPYYFLLQRRLRAGSSYALFPFMFGPDVHWTSLVMSGGFTVLLIVATMTYMFAFGLFGQDAQLSGWAQGYAMLAMVLFGHCMNIQMTLYRTRSEQSLMVLAPGLPNGDAQTRTLLKMLMRPVLTIWALTVLTGVLAVHSGELNALLNDIIYFSCFGISWLVLSLLRDYGRVKSAHDGQLLYLFLGLIVCLPLLVFMHIKFNVVPDRIIYGIFFVFTVWLLVRRWRALMRLSAVFPVGRSV